MREVGIFMGGRGKMQRKRKVEKVTLMGGLLDRNGEGR